jgi:hypothetical protein
VRTIIVLMIAAIAFGTLAPAATRAEDLPVKVEEAGSSVFAWPAGSDARERFLTIERFARLPMAEQEKQLPQFYKGLDWRTVSQIVEGILSSNPRDILNTESGPYDGNTVRWAQQLASVASVMSAEQVADKLGRDLWLNVAARARVLQVLKNHAEATSALIGADLNSRQKDAVDRATTIIVSLKLRQFNDRLMVMFMADDEFSGSAYSALVWRADAATLKPLLERVAREPRFLTRCSGLFMGPLAGEPAEPALVKLLGSPDTEIRYHAAYALQECRDPNLAQPTARLAREKEARFRFLAAHWASKLPGPSFRSVRGELLPLLRDSDDEVRFYALLSFGKQKDLAAGPVILEMLRGELSAEQHKIWVMQAMNELSGNTWNYDLHNWGPAKPGNQQAIERFAAWLEKQQANVSDGANFACVICENTSFVKGLVYENHSNTSCCGHCTGYIGAGSGGGSDEG